MVLLLIVSKVNMKLNKNLKVEYFCAKPYVCVLVLKIQKLYKCPILCR